MDLGPRSDEIKQCLLKWTEQFGKSTINMTEGEGKAKAETDIKEAAEREKKTTEEQKAWAREEL